PADARSDIFAFGAILYELASGSRAFPFEGAALDQALLKNSPAPLSITSPLREAMGEVIESCLDKEVLVRRQRIKNAVVELKLGGVALRRAARPPPPPAPPAPPRGAVFAFPQAAPPSPLPIHAVPAPVPAPVAPITPHIEHFLVPPDALPLSAPRE